MTNEQINIAIAEICGTKKWSGCDLPPPAMLLDVPDYVNDLNSMHEAEKTLALKEQMLYQGMVGKVTGNKCPALFGQIHATARKRAEALLKTLGKWERTR